jgi:hypothetical protein
MILEPQSFTKLVLCGIAASAVLLSTLRQVADKDYEFAASPRLRRPRRGSAESFNRKSFPLATGSFNGFRVG